MSNILCTFPNHDAHGIDEDDARQIAAMLLQAYPNARFSVKVDRDGVLGITSDADDRGIEILVHRAFALGAKATRNMWER